MGEHLEMPKLLRLLFWLLLSSLLVTLPPALAQEDFDKGIDLEREDGFLPLVTNFGTVLYPPAYLDRASAVMDRLQLTGVELYIWSKNAVKVDLLVFDLAGWQKRFPDRLFGLPARVSPTSIAVAANGTPGTVRVWGMLLGRPVPPAPGRPILGTSEQAMTLILCDIMLQLELGKIYAEQVGYGEGSARWPIDVMAHLTAIAFLDSHDVGQLRIYDDLFATWGEDPGPHSLESLEEGLPLAKQLWYQARFREAAALIREEDASHAISRIGRKMRKRKEREPAEVILDLYPELEGWLESAFGVPPVN